MPRVISGSAGGRRLRTPGGRATRPTSDRVKEGWFSALTARTDIADLQVLDLFAGSGQLAIEALSRGAAHALLVERGASARAVIRDNLAVCGLAERAEVRGGQAAAVVRACVESDRQFDLIFIDPPYSDLAAAIDQLMEAGLTALCKPFAYVMIEHELVNGTTEGADILLNYVTELKRVRRCRYGTTVVDFYQAIGT